MSGRQILGDSLISWITSDKQVYRALASIKYLPSLIIPDAEQYVCHLSHLFTPLP